MGKSQNKKSSLDWQKLLPIPLILLGLGLIIVAIGADLAGLGDRAGLGPNQIALAVAGLVVLLSGVGLLTSIGQRFLDQLQTRLSAMPPVLQVKPSGLFILATWFGLLFGLIEVAIWAVLSFFPRFMFITSRDIIWMAPLFYIVALLIAALILAVIAWRWSKFIPLPITVFIFCLPGVLSLLLLAPGLHVIASFLLTIGLAVQVARMAAGNPVGFYRLVRATFGWTNIFFKKKGNQPQSRLAQSQTVPSDDLLPNRRQFLVRATATLAGLAVGTRGWTTLTEQSALTRLPSISQKMPNILLIVLDTVRAQNLSLYGYHRLTTPNLERFAKMGVSFERAFSTAPWTLPSHASMFTGRWSHEHQADLFKPLSNTYPTLAEILSQYGYLTAGFVANLDFGSTPYGLNRGFQHYEDFPISLGQTILSTSLGQEITNINQLRQLTGYLDLLNRKDAARITNDFLTWFQRRDQNRPFFAFLNYYDAHQPYFPPEAFELKFGPKRDRGDFLYFTNAAERAEMWNLSPDGIHIELDAYDGAIAYMDHHLGVMFDELANRGTLENTLVIVTSDHGEQFGEHRLFGHTNSLYMPTIHVPLLIIPPKGISVGQKIADLVSLRHLPATVMDIIGHGAEAPFPGTSLAGYWQGSGIKSEPILAELTGGRFFWLPRYPVAKGNMKSLVIDRYHYIKNGDGVEELYDYESDPAEEHDLTNSDQGRQLIAQFRTSLDAILA
jgi:arylsulfatase A-like enzyme